MVPRFESDSNDASPLGQPLHFEFANRTANNRFLKAAMTERISSWDWNDLDKRGIPSKELINVYRRWGEGGFGLILTGNVMISQTHLEARGNPIIPLDSPFQGERFEAFKQLAAEAKKQGALCVAQVSHPGRQVDQSLQPHPISASDIQLEGDLMGMKFAKPRAVTKDEIKDLVRRWTFVAEYLYKAGYDGIQLHGAHGYLLAQFLSQTTNKRDDEYGGSLQNRARIILDIADSIRTKIPASTGFMLGIKINSVEFQQGGFSPEEAAELCALLEQHTFDFVELSGGTYEELAFLHKRDSTKKRESFFLEFAEMIVPQLKKTKAYVTGGFRTVGAMVKALDHVHGVGLARAACQEFDLPKLMLDGKVAGSIKQEIDLNNFGLTNIVAGTQIGQVGKDQAPLDFSDPKIAEAFMKDMQVWMGKMSDMNKAGYVDLQSVTVRPYSERVV